MSFFHRGRLVLRSYTEVALVLSLLFRIVSCIGLVAGALRLRLEAAFLLFGHSDLRKVDSTSWAASGMPGEPAARAGTRLAGFRLQRP